MINLLSSSITQYIVNFDGAENIARSVSFWAVITFIIASIITLILVKDAQKKRITKIVLLSVGVILMVGIIITFMVLNGKEAAELQLSALLYAPLITFCVCLVLSVVISLIKPKKIIKTISGIVLLLSLIAVIVCLTIYYESGASLDLNWINAEDVDTLALWIGAGALVLIIVLTAVFTDKTKGLDFDAKSLTYAGVLGGLSLALSYVKLFRAPMGGSITLAQVLPIMLYSYIFGTKKGVILGFAIGMLQAAQDPWLLHPAQFLLDYPIAYASFGLTGCFAKDKKINNKCISFLLGSVLACICRFLSHFMAGAFAFGSFAPDNFSSVYIYSLVYTSSYVLPDTAISIVLGCILMMSKSFVKVLSGINPDKKNKVSTVTPIENE